MGKEGAILKGEQNPLRGNSCHYSRPQPTHPGTVTGKSINGQIDWQLTVRDASARRCPLLPAAAQCGHFCFTRISLTPPFSLIRWQKTGPDKRRAVNLKLTS